MRWIQLSLSREISRPRNASLWHLFAFSPSSRYQIAAEAVHRVQMKICSLAKMWVKLKDSDQSMSKALPTSHLNTVPGDLQITRSNHPLQNYRLLDSSESWYFDHPYPFSEPDTGTSRRNAGTQPRKRTEGPDLRAEFQLTGWQASFKHLPTVSFCWSMRVLGVMLLDKSKRTAQWSSATIAIQAFAAQTMCTLVPQKPSPMEPELQPMHETTWKPQWHCMNWLSTESMLYRWAALSAPRRKAYGTWFQQVQPKQCDHVLTGSNSGCVPVWQWIFDVLVLQV